MNNYDYILKFKKLGFGMFVHFGLYSAIEKGEWYWHYYKEHKDNYLKYAKSFNPAPNFANKLVLAAKKSGCKYITFTTRHHDGFSLFDTKGLSNFDAQKMYRRDFVLEFVTACKKYGLVPFLYHTMLDWSMPSYKNDFSSYLKYLRDSVQLLCTNYGEVGGFWFDGKWDKTDCDWQEDLLYATIRKFQPNAMIITNSGLNALGQRGHFEIDSVTFERGKPRQVESFGKPLAGEMCEVLNQHWGYAKCDINYKSVKQLIQTFAKCRKNDVNFLLNVGLNKRGNLQPIDKAIFEQIGKWCKMCGNVIYYGSPSQIKTGGGKNFALKYNNVNYLFVYDAVMLVDDVSRSADQIISFKTDQKVKKMQWLDDKTNIDFVQEGSIVSFKKGTFPYGTDFVVRVAKIS